MRHRDIVKIDGVSVYRALGQSDLKALAREFIRRLVERDVTVPADAEELNINAALGSDCSGVALAFGLGVCVAVKEVDILLLYINKREKILVHKSVVAVFVILRQIAVFIKVEGADLCKGHLARLILLNKILIGGHGGRARCEAEHAVGL